MKRRITTTIITLNLLLCLLVAGTTPAQAQGCPTPGFAPAANFGAGDYPRSVAVGDFNLDGKPDLATANEDSDNVSVLLGNGSGGFGAAINFGVGVSPLSVAVGDFNLDGKPDLAVANSNSDNVSVLLGDGSGSVSEVFCKRTKSIILFHERNIYLCPQQNRNPPHNLLANSCKNS